MPVRGLVRHRFAAVGLSLVLLVEAGAVAPPTSATSGAPPIDPATPLVSAPRQGDPPSAEPPPIAPGPETRDAPVELPAERTLDSRTFLNPDGTYTTHLFATPIHYAAADGTLRPIEPIPVAGRSEGVAYETKDGPVRVEFGTSSTGVDAVALTTDEYRVSYWPINLTGVPGAVAPADRAPSSDGQHVTYPNVYPNVDLRYSLLPNGVKEDIVLKAPGTATSFAFVLDSPGLTPEILAVGSITIGTKETSVFTLPAPFMVDSAPESDGDGARSTSVRYELVARDGETVLVISADPVWLADPKRVFPVYIDPTYVTTADTFISSAYPNTSFNAQWNPNEGGYYEMWNGYYDATSGTNYAFVKTALPPTQVSVTNAKFWILAQHTYMGGTPSGIYLGKLTSAFTTSQTWNMTHPSWTALTSTTVTDNNWAQFTVTSLVQQWVDGTAPNHGVRIYQASTAQTLWKRLRASENSTNKPYLEVTWHQPTATTTAAVWNNNRVLSWSYADPGSQPQSHYQVQVSTSSTFSTILSDSGVLAGTASSWNIPGGVSLTDGTRYYWRVKVKNGTGWSDWALPTSRGRFIWDISPPGGSISINGGAVSTNTSTVQVSLSGSDPNSASVYANDGRGTTSLVAGCGSVVCNAGWGIPVLGTDRAQGAVVVESNSGGSTLTWHSLTVDVGTLSHQSMAMDVRRDAVGPINVGVVSDDNDGFRYELWGDTNVSTLAWTATSTPNAWTTKPINLAFTPGVWYRLIIASSDATGATYNLWWYPRDTAQPTIPTFSTSGVYLPKPRLHLFQYASTVAPGTVWLDDVRIFDGTAAVPYGSGVTGVRFSTDGGSNWSNWEGYRNVATYALPAGSGNKTLSAQFRDAAGNVSGTLSDSIDVDFGNLGRQSQHRFETWDLGAGDELAVNLATGNLGVTHPLVTLPYRGGSLPLTLTYTSQDQNTVGLGSGWRLDLQRRLLMNEGTDVTFFDADGAAYDFTNAQTNGTVTTYTRPPGLYATLVRDTSQGIEFTLTYRDQSRDKFDDLGGGYAILVRTEDRHGNGLDLAYGGGTMNIATVTDPAGRVVDFTWDTAPTPDRLTAITDWAWINGSGEVQTTATGSRRTYRFFYDGSGNLIGWSDPLNTAGSCSTGGSHLTCLSYSGGLLAQIDKTQTYTTFPGYISTAIRTLTTMVEYAGSRVASVTDAEQAAQEGPSTTFTADFADRVVVRRPTTTTTYGLQAVADTYARIGSAWRQFNPLTEIEQRTTWDSSFPIELATVIDNATALQSTPSRTLTYTYVPGSLGNLLKVVEPLTGSTNRWTEFLYNANNDVTQRTVSEDGSPTLRTITRYCYEATCATNGLGPDLLKQIDNYVDGLNGTNDTDVVTEYQYDAYGQRIRVIRHNRDQAGAVLDDRVDGFTFDAAGNLTAEIDNHVNGTVTNPGDDITPNATTQARTDLTTVYAYDTAGNQVSSADPRRAIELAKGTSMSSTDFVTGWTYDALNQRVNERTPSTPVVDPNPRESETRYDELGLQRWHQDFGGPSWPLVTAHLIDRAGRTLATYQDTSGESARLVAAATYDPDARVLTAKDERQVNDLSLGATAYVYDSLGRQTTVTTSSGGADPAIPATGYDGLDRRTSYEVGMGAAASLLTLYAYDIGGRTTESNDGFGSSGCTRHAYDYRDLATSSIEGLTAGSPCAGTGLRTITRTHDGLGRLVLSQVTAGQGLNDKPVEETFDAVGNRRSTSATQSGITTSTTYTLNLLDQVNGEQRSNGTWAKTNYDPAGNVTDRCLWPSQPTDPCLPAGSTFNNPQPSSVTTTSSDARNQRISLVDATTNQTTTYDPNHSYQVSAVYLPTLYGREHQTLYGYDDRHRLETVTHQLCAIVEHPSCSGPNVLQATGSDTYEYDDADSRTRVTETTGAGSLDRHYCYDAHNRLVATWASTSCSSNPMEAFSYDDAGNRLTAGSPGAPVSFTYDASGLLTGCSPSCGTLAHDAAGQLTRWNGWFFEYDAEGRMIAACQNSGPCSPGLYNEVAYTYDGDGHRTQIKKFVTGNGTPTEIWDFRYQGNAIVEERLNGAVVRTYLVDEAGAIVKMTIPSGQPNVGTYLVTWNGHGDALGLWRVEASGSLTLANSYTYTTWGTPTTAAHNGIPDLGFRFLYVGQHDVQWDSIHGLSLHYMHARHYSPNLGRFLQPDSSRSESNHHAYARNNPTSIADPDGELGILVAWIAHLGSATKNRFQPVFIYGFTWFGAGVVVVTIRVYLVNLSGRGIVSRLWNTTGFGMEGAFMTRGYLHTGICGDRYQAVAIFVSAWPPQGPVRVVRSGVSRVPCR